MPETADQREASQVRRARGRVLWAFVVVALGLWAGREWPVVGSTWVFALAAACAAAAGPARGWLCRVLLAAALFLLSAGWFIARVHELPAGALARQVGGSETPALVTLDGLVLDDPRHATPNMGALARFQPTAPVARFDLALSAMKTEGGSSAVSGRVWVRVRGDAALLIDGRPVRAGDRVRLTGLFEGVSPPTNPGEPDLRQLAAQGGVAGTVTLSNATLINAAGTRATLAERARASWLRWRADLRARSRDVVRRAAGEDASARALLAGLILGEYDESNTSLREAFARQGLAHVLSISGFHLAVMAGLTLTMLRATGDRGWLEPALVAVLLLLYLMIVPPAAPIMRSAAMVLLLLAAEASGRRYDRLTLLGWIAVLLLAWRPCDLWSLGFQLSVGLTATLFWLADGFSARLFRRPLRGTVISREEAFARRMKRAAQETLASAVLCWLVSLPVLMHRIGLVSPLGVAATLLVTPLVVVALWIGYLALLVGTLAPGAADIAGGVLSALLGASGAIVNWLDGVPFSSLMSPPVSGWWAGLTTLVVLLTLRAWSAARGVGEGTRLARHGAAGALCAAWFMVQALTAGRAPVGAVVRIDTLDVGNGTCHVIRSSAGAMLWDCGSLRPGGVQHEAVRAARALGVWRTPTVIISHPDIDHFGAVLDITGPLGVERVVTSERFVAQARAEPDGAVAAVMDELSRRGVDVRVVAEGDSWEWGGLTLRVLSPPAGAAWPLDNNHSLVVSMDSAATERTDLLLTGDIEDDAVERVLDAYPALRPLVLELPHHGSVRAAAQRMVLMLDPGVVLQSTGRRRADDPRWAPFRTGRRWLSTAEQGASWAEVRGGGSVVTGTHTGR